MSRDSWVEWQHIDTICQRTPKGLDLRPTRPESNFIRPGTPVKWISVCSPISVLSLLSVVRSEPANDILLSRLFGAVIATMPSLHQFRWLICAFVLCGTVPLSAQIAQLPPQIQTIESKSDRGQVDPTSRPEGTTPRVVLEGKALEDFFKSLAPDKIEITSLEISGQANEKTATLQATLKIYIPERYEGLWVKVPVGMPEAISTGLATYDGPGQHRSDAQTTANTGRMVWLLKGAGHHTLKLPLITILGQRIHTRRRLRLTLPVAATSHLKLQLPNNDVKIETSGRSGPLKSTKEKKTFVDVYGLGTDFDLTWEQLPQVKATGNRLQLDANRIIADFSKTESRLSAEQTITAARGSFEQLTVTLPEGLRVLDITERRDAAAEQYLRDYRIEETSGEPTVTVFLSRPCTDSLRLSWELEAIGQSVPGKFTFALPKIAEINVNKGDVEVIAPAGFEMARLDGRDATRRSVASALTNDQIATAYRFTSNQSRVVLDIREIEPQFSVQPAMQIDAVDGSLLLRANFVCSVRRGAMQRLELKWPDYEVEKWDSLEVLLDGGLQDWTYELTDDKRILIQFTARKSREFEFAFATRRPMPRVVGTDGSEMAAVSLPYLSTDTVAADRSFSETPLIISEAAELSFQLKPADERTSMTLEPLRPEDDAVSNEADARLQRYRLNSGNLRFEATLKEKQRETQATTELTIQIQNDQAVVEQRLKFEVLYRRLNELQLQIPESVAEQVELLYGSVRLQQVQSTAFAQSVALPEEVLGPTEIVARFNVKIDSGDVAIPLIRSLDAPFDSTRFEVSSGTLNSEPADQDLWARRVYSRDGNAAWETNDAVNSVQLKLTRDTTRSEHRFAVRRALIQTEIDGGFQSLAQFQIEGTPEQLTLLIPPNCLYDRIRWNGQPVEPTTVEQTEQGQLVSLRIDPQATPGLSVLAIDFHAETVERDRWFSRHMLSAPQFPDGVWTDETHWQVILGGQQLLFDFSDDYSARYRWERDRLGWHRKSLPYTVTGFSNMVPTGPARSYMVARLGRNPSLEIQTIHQTVLFLVAAVIALVFGFVLFQLPRGYALAVIGIAAIAISVAAMIRPIPVELFIQPATIGLALAGLASSWEWLMQTRRYRRRRKTAIPSIEDMTVRPTMQLSTGSRSGLPEDRTVVRNEPIKSGSQGSSKGAAGS